MWQSLMAKGQYREALPILEKLAAEQRTVQILHALGTCYKRLGNYPKAFQAYDAVLQHNPAYLDTLKEMPSVANVLGLYDKSKAALTRLDAMESTSGLKVTLATLLPQMMHSKEQIQKLREEFVQNLDALVAKGIVLKGDIHNSLIHSSFYLAYHGMNDKDIQRKLAETYEKLCPSLLFTARHVRERKPRSEKIRVGFFSKYFGEAHPVAVHFGGLIAGLAKEQDIEVYILSKQSMQATDLPPAWLKDVCKQTVQVGDSLQDARKTIEKLALDVLIYTEVGMDPFTYFLAFSKLAPVQCMMGGHPDTTGIKAIDYFISSVPVEPENGQEHYNEKLIKLTNIPVSIKKPAMPAVYGDRRAFGLPQELNLYICPMMLQKIHPEFDRAVEGILMKDPKAMVLFFSGIGDWQQQMMARLKNCLSEDKLRRIGFVPHLPMAQFIQFLSCADAILDSFHFGGGTTNYIAIGIGAPIVTLPSDFMRGRVAYALYQQMGGSFDALIARNQNDYIEKAVALANDKALQKKLHEQILASHAGLFENPNAVSDYAAMIRSLVPQTVSA